MTSAHSRLASSGSHRTGPDIWAWCVVGIIVLHAIVFGALQILSGDDIGYSQSIAAFDGKSLPYLRFVKFHYLEVNGRMANLFAPFWLSVVPRWVLDIANGLVCGLFYAMTLIMAGVGRRGFATGKLIVTALLLFTFPWWDSFMLFDVMFNYVWSSTFVLVVLWLLLRDHSCRFGWIWWPFAALAASMHEGMGVPVAMGIIVWLLLTRSYRNLTHTQRGVIISFVIGAIFVFVSPGIWERFLSLGSDGHLWPNDPMWLLVLKSDFYVLILMVVVVIEALCDRTRLIEALRTSWVIFVVAAIISACFSAVSGIVGRSGWFASLMALIALGQWVVMRGCRISRSLGAIASTVLSVMILVHLVFVDTVQFKMSRELKAALTQYHYKCDEPVYMDYHPWNDYQWLTLSKVRGVPESYESYILSQYAAQYAYPDAPSLVVLPKAAENIYPDTLVKVADGYLFPSMEDFPTSGTLTGYKIDGRIYLPVRFTDKKKRQMCYLTPLRVRPGDRICLDRWVEI